MNTQSDIASLELRIRELEQALQLKSNEVEDIKKEFFLNISHNIRTPLNSIVGFSKLLADQTNGNEKTKSYQQYIKTGSDQLLSYIHDLMEYSKYLAGQLIIKSVEINIVDLLFEIKEEYNVSGSCIGELKAKLVLNYDPGDIEQSFILDKNLVLKSIIHSLNFLKKDSSNGIITINYWYSGNSILKISIEDQRNNMDRLLPMLKTDDKSSPRKLNERAMNSGFGLQIAKLIIEKLGGVLALHPNQFEGFTIEILLPCAIRNETYQTVNYSDGNFLIS